MKKKIKGILSGLLVIALLLVGCGKPGRNTNARGIYKRKFERDFPLRFLDRGNYGKYRRIPGISSWGKSWG